MSDHKDIAEILAVISAAYPNFDNTKQTMDVYYQVLKDIPSDLLKAAAYQCIAESGRRFAPSVGEIRGAVGEIIKATNGQPSSYEAWEEVRKGFNGGGYLGKYGHYSHPLIQKAVDILGDRNLRMSEDQVSDRARFIQCYEQLSERADRDALMLPEVREYIGLNAPAEIKRLADKLGAK